MKSGRIRFAGSCTALSLLLSCLFFVLCARVSAQSAQPTPLSALTSTPTSEQTRSTQDANPSLCVTLQQLKTELLGLKSQAGKLKLDLNSTALESQNATELSVSESTPVSQSLGESTQASTAVSASLTSVSTSTSSLAQAHTDEVSATSQVLKDYQADIRKWQNVAYITGGVGIVATLILSTLLVLK